MWSRFKQRRHCGPCSPVGAHALDELFDDLLARRGQQPEGWPEYARLCLSYPLRGLVHQDPFTYRALSKPRGYAGDAVMMDYIYGLGEARLAVVSREYGDLGVRAVNGSVRQIESSDVRWPSGERLRQTSASPSQLLPNHATDG